MNIRSILHAHVSIIPISIDKPNKLKIYQFLPYLDLQYSLQFCFVNSLLQSGLNSLHHIGSNCGSENISEDCSVIYNSCEAIVYIYCWKILSNFIKWNNIYVRIIFFLKIANHDLIHSREYLLSWVRISFLCPALFWYPRVHRTLPVLTTLLAPMVPCCSTVLFYFL